MPFPCCRSILCMQALPRNCVDNLVSSANVLLVCNLAGSAIISYISGVISGVKMMGIRCKSICAHEVFLMFLVRFGWTRWRSSYWQSAMGLRWFTVRKLSIRSWRRQFVVSMLKKVPCSFRNQQQCIMVYHHFFWGYFFPNLLWIYDLHRQMVAKWFWAAQEPSPLILSKKGGEEGV